MMSLAASTILVGILCSVPCALLGCHLVLRRQSMLGDAISHAVLPGLAIAYLATGSLASPGMLLGAVIVGALTAIAIDTLQRSTRIHADASTGIVYTVLFAIGVLLLTHAADHVDLDPGCVLYGQIDIVGLDTLTIGGDDVAEKATTPTTTRKGIRIPRAAITLVPTLLFVLVFLCIFWKELNLAAFDPSLADALGYRTRIVETLLMAMVAIVTVVSFEAVGSILVVAMLIVPAATGLILARSVFGMMMIAGVSAVMSSMLGYFAAEALNTSTAGMMAVAAGGLFLVSAVFRALR